MKKNNFLLLFFVALSVFAMQSCKDKDKNVQPQGVNTTFDPNNQQNYDFMATKAGSEWRMGFRPINPEDTGIGVRRAMGIDSTVAGFRYSYYERNVIGSPHITPEYFGKNDGFYTTTIDMTGSQQQYIQYAFYKDSATINEEWPNTGYVSYMGFAANVTITTRVVSVGSTERWNDSTFTNVLKVHSEITTDFPLVPNAGTIDIWCVRGLGIIKEEANIDLAGFYTRKYADSLISWSLVR